MKTLTMLAIASAAIAGCGRGGSDGGASPPATPPTEAQATVTADCAALPSTAVDAAVFSSLALTAVA